MSFNPWNFPLKIQKPKVEVHLGVWGFIPSLSYTLGSMKCDYWASLLARTFTSPCFGRKPKAKVATKFICGQFVILFTWVVFIGLINTIWSMQKTLIVVVGSAELWLKFLIVETPHDLPPNFVIDLICTPFLTTFMLGTTIDSNPMVVILAPSD